MTAHPFIKWVGGKTKLLPELLRRVPESYSTYHEPFLGGGALFFALRPKKAILSDLNLELVRTYQVVQKYPGRLIWALREMMKEHERGGLPYYLEVRARKPADLDSVDCAACLIYLNKTCFNGLYRVNKSGQFNVPMGKFKYPPTICDAENIQACSLALRDVQIDHADFSLVEQHAVCGDFVYLDPPYVPASRNADFTAYTKEGFGPKDQQALASLAEILKERDVRVLLSNAGNAEVARLYEASCFKIEEVSMRRNVNCQAEGRAAVREYLIT